MNENMENTENVENKVDERSFGKFVVIALGQFVSMMGSGLSRFALGIWLFETTGKATYFALSITMYFLPILLFSPFAGSLADRKNRKKIIMLTDTLDAVVKISMAVLFFSGNMQVWMVYPFIFISTTLGVFQGPSFGASVPLLVGKEKLSKALGLRRLSSSAETMLVPVIGMGLYLAIGLKGVLLIDFASYFIAILSIMFFKIPQPKIENPQHKSFFKTVLVDFKYVWDYLSDDKKELFYLILILAGFNLIASSSMSLFSPMLLSMFSKETCGVVLFVRGVGLVISSILGTVLPNNPKKIKTAMLLYLSGGIGLSILGVFQSWLLVALGGFVFVFCLPYSGVMIGTVIRTKVEPHILGRLSGFMSVIGVLPIIFTSLTAGPLADNILEPLMSENGILGSGFIGNIIGSGPGRGIGLLFIILGLILALFFAVMLFNKRMLTMEERLPDRLQ